MKKLCQIRVRLLILMIFLATFLISIPLFVQGNESTSIAGNFRITEGRYWETEDLDQCVINEFGSGYQIADWNDILVYADNIEEWANDLGMVWGDTAIVRRNGEDFYAGGRSHYFIARWDHNKPGYWYAHDNIDDHLISLGAWYNIHYPILAIAFDITPPEITVSDDPIVLWPPNHKYYTIEISDFVLSVYDIVDVDCGIEDVVITSVSSDEPENIIEGDGYTWNDIVIVDSQTVKLRAERQGKGNGRVYTINFEVTDASGNTAQGSFKIYVPHDKKPGVIAIDDGASAGYIVYP